MKSLHIQFSIFLGNSKGFWVKWETVIIIYRIHKKFHFNCRFQVRHSKEWTEVIVTRESCGSVFIVLPTSPLPTQNYPHLDRDLSSPFCSYILSRSMLFYSHHLSSYASLKVPELLSDGSLILMGARVIYAATDDTVPLKTHLNF